MKYYLIDFDNVNTCKDLKAWDSFTEEYCIYLFFTPAKAKIDVVLVADHGKASLEFIEVPEGKQSLDMHLVSVLGFLINNDKTGEFVIVSKDTDYDNIIQFWEKRENIKISKCSKIESVNNSSQKKSEPKPEAKSELKPEEKSEVKKQIASEGVTGNPILQLDDFTLAKMALNADIQKLLSEAGYKRPKAPAITQIVLQHLGEDKFASNVHNELMKTYTNADTKAIYNAIKGLLKKYSDVKKQPDDSDNSTAPVGSGKEEKPSEEIREILKSAGKEADTVNYVGNLYDAHFNEKDYKQLIYRAIISKYGQKQGLDIYNRIKKYI